MKTDHQKFASPIVIDWPRRWRDIHGECPTAKLRELNKVPEKSLYWENSIKFAEYSQQKIDYHLRPSDISEEAILKLVSRKDAKYE